MSIILAFGKHWKNRYNNTSIAFFLKKQQQLFSFKKNFSVFLESYDFCKSKIHCAKKQSFPLIISAVSATKSEGN